MHIYNILFLYLHKRKINIIINRPRTGSQNLFLMTTINEISNHIMGYFDGTLDAFGYTAQSVNEISNPDESYMGTLNLQFREYPIDDDEKVETYCRESDAFEQYVIEFINSHWDEHHPLKELNPNHHYMSNSYGDTIQVHFNDESLFIIITMTGQY